jgi:hypothetical protein
LPLQALATKLLDQGTGGRRRLSAVAPLNLTDAATIRSVLSILQSSFSDPLQFGQGPINTISGAQLTAAAGGIANVNSLAASATSVTVSLLCMYVGCALVHIAGSASTAGHSPAVRPMKEQAEGAASCAVHVLRDRAQHCSPLSHPPVS